MVDPEKKPTIGIIMGDPAGIGPEVALKSLTGPEIHDICRAILIGDYDILDDHAEQFAPELSLSCKKDDREGTEGAPFAVEVRDLGSEYGPVGMGRASEAGGRITLDAIRMAFRLALDGELDGIVMAPINKEALAKADAAYHSEFELFAELAGVERVWGVVKWERIFRTTVTGHIPFREIVEHLTPSAIVDAAHVLRETIVRFGIRQPRLAVAALNPHAGERGLIGDEEQTIIAPAVESLIESGMDVKGPIPADTVFARAQQGEFDGIVFLYHDQGNIAMKSVAFGEGVVIYAGLPVAAATPGHGSAYDIAGKGIAREGNMIESLKTVVQMAGAEKSSL
ncbi:MAG: PdxA family dehydrogenase [Chloroflexota bacterium]